MVAFIMVKVCVSDHYDLSFTSNSNGTLSDF